MDPVQQAISDKLAASTAITALLGDGEGGIYHEVAPRTAKTPFIVFSLSSGAYTWAFNNVPVFENDVWLVKAVDRSGSGRIAGEIAALIDSTLSDADLMIGAGSGSGSGGDATQRTLYLRKQAPVSYPEMDGADTYRHRGFLFRLIRRRV